MRRPGAPPLPRRTGIIQRHLDALGGGRYLEIGLGDGGVFLHVDARRKVGVDPGGLPLRRRLRHPLSLPRSRVVRATSDEFFAGLDPEARFEVSFVDGYHTWEQALRDVDGCLRHATAEGVVVMHDCNPPNEPAGMRDPEEAAARADSDGSWCGDVWKAVAYLRGARPDLSVEVLDTDFGVGIVKQEPSEPIALDPGAVGALTYGDLDRDRAGLLGLRRDPGDVV